MNSMVGKLVIFFFLGQISITLGLPPYNKTTSFVPFIVGGQDANIADYPYQVQILIQGQHACGGSILTNTFVLSAAHCFEGVSSVSQITIRVGSSYRTSGGQIVNVKKITSHTSFSSVTYDYDVAVVELASSLTFGTGVQPIALPDSSFKIVNGKIAVATGWGLTTDGGSLANQLQVVNLPLITTKSCQNTVYSSAITSRMFCAGESGKDTCAGDSGGPLVVDGVQIGIVSWGDICGQVQTPGVYTKITKFLNFISKNVN